MFNLILSNKLEKLIDQLAHRLSEPLSHPFLEEIIVVQHRGMARYLTRALADRLGILMNTSFPFPNVLLKNLAKTDHASTRLFDPEVLRWRILEALTQFQDHPDFKAVQAYCDDLTDQNISIKSFQLAQRLANIFDQYQLFRSQWLDEWDRGVNPISNLPDSAWQFELWRVLSQEGEITHRGKLFYNYQLDSTIKPERLSIFGINHLPLLNMRALMRLSQEVPVDFYTLSPSQDYWMTVLSPREKAKAATLDELETPSNPILANLGITGRLFLDALLTDEQIQWMELYEKPESDHQLHQLQTDILENREGSIGAMDGSIQFHSCHTPMREVEVLHDIILECLEHHRDWDLEDVIVMTPDIETYAPFIQSVFNTSNEWDNDRLPASISDRSPDSEHGVIKAVMQLLSLPEHRFEASRILELLDLPSIQAAIPILEEQVEKIRLWIQDAGIRWGFDSSETDGTGVSMSSGHAWMDGFKRALLGSACSDGETEYEGNPIYTQIEGHDLDILGRVIDFVHNLHKLNDILSQSNDMSEWTRIVREEIFPLIIFKDEDLSAQKTMENLLVALEAETQAASLKQTLSREVFVDVFMKGMEPMGSVSSFLNGKITFCSMHPMRSIPFKVICLLGMNDGVFPRLDRRPGFDLMAMAPQKLDPSRHEEDRYLFLELLLSAREKLIISFIGRDAQDNSERIPSIAVSELMDLIQSGETSKDTTKPLLTEHPLQPFSPKNFYGAKTAFSKVWVKIAQTIVGHMKDPFTSETRNRPFFQLPPSSSDTLESLPAFDELVAFFCHPSKAILRHYGIMLDQRNQEIKDIEPFDLNALEKYLYRNSELESQLGLGHQGSGTTVEWPGPDLKEIISENLDEEKIEFERLLVNAFDFKSIKHHDIQLDLPYGTRLETTLPSLTNLTSNHEVFFFYRHGALNTKNRIRLFLSQLLASAAGYSIPAIYIDQTFSKKKQPALVMNPVQGDQAQLMLSAYVSMFKTAHQTFFPFYPDSSFAFAKSMFEGKGQTSSLNLARKQFDPPDFSGSPRPNEGEDAYTRCFVRGRDPFDEPFEQLSMSFWAPFFEYTGAMDMGSGHVLSILQQYGLIAESEGNP